ncbi:EAL domain-containing protein [Alteromonas sp. a30]|uniref:EAL domain-containing protein n=1 Tax=Alteromonas sp. a30 TaxID=2730917 RepID=UPI002280ADE8|nr:EAL domain-containing protein [Alteromonas sp. a30]MCY7296857.1 EAL domain-containing protein [Alteromonas sp. a30]
MKINRILILCVLLPILLIISPLSLAKLSNAGFEDYSRFLRRLSPNEGLSQSEVTRTIQDENGFIWIGTRMGLNRYDGYKVKKIPGPNNIFNQEEILALHLDNQGYLWVSTLASGLYRVNPVTLVTERYFNGIMPEQNTPFAVVSDMIQASDNAIWLVLNNSIQHFDVNNRKMTSLYQGQKKDTWITNILTYQDNIIAASTDGIITVNQKTGDSSPLPFLPDNISNERNLNVRKIFLDNELGLVIGTKAGLYSLDIENKKTGKSRTLIPEIGVWDIEKVDDYFLIASNKGLFHFNPKTNEYFNLIQFSRSDYRTIDNNVTDLFRDKSGNFWLGSRSQGVLIWSDVSTRFKHISTTTTIKLSHESTWKILQDKDGFIWIATDNGINKIDLEKGTFQHFLGEESGSRITLESNIIDMFWDESDPNQMWVHTGTGLFLFNKSTGELSRPYVTEQHRNLIYSEYIYGVHVKDAENIFFFNDDGHFRYNSVTGEAFALTGIDKQANPFYSWAFLAALPNRPNTILLTTSGHLYEYNFVTDKLHLIYKVKNFQRQAYDSVDSWVIDQDGILWIAFTGEGLIGLDSDTYEEKYRFDVNNQLNNDQVYQLQLDENNQIWLSSQYGLYKFNAERNHVDVYLANDGLLSSEFNGSSSIKLQNGYLAFGSPLGINYFNPNHFQIDQFKKDNYEIHLSDISLLSDKNAKILNSARDTIEIDYDQYGLKLEFSTLEFRQQERTLYNIHLDGPHTLHLEHYLGGEFLLPRVSPGHYTLTISAISAQHGIKSKPLVLQMVVNNTPWLATPAKVFYVLILLILFLNYTVNRKAKERELKALHKRTQASHNRMQMAMFGSNSGVWDYWLEKDTIYVELIPSRFDGESSHLQLGMQELIQKIKTDDTQGLLKRWEKFLSGESVNWDATYQVKTQDKEWPWFRVIGRVIAYDSEGKATRVIGTYTNITETKLNEDKAKLFGEAFRQINDWVLILDEKLIPVTANEAFQKQFNMEHKPSPEILSLLLKSLGEEKYQEFKEILTGLKPRGSWQGEEVIDVPNGERSPVLIKIHAIAQKKNIICHYVIVVSDITQQKDAEEKLRHLAHYDYLTDLPNRQLLFEKIENKIKQKNSRFAVLFIDLDKFKQVNDLYGHFIGDQLLKKVSSILLNCVGHKDIVARQSGDEFIILIDKFKDINEISHIAQTVLKQLSKTIVLDDLHVHITSSVGIAIYPDDSNCSSEIIKKADLAMIHAKNKGRGEFQYFTQDINEKAHLRLTLENDLQHACSNNEFVNYYQPIVDIQKNKVVGAELLLRWFNADKLIPPYIFIPIAEEIGLISNMTIQAIEKALVDYKKQFITVPDFYISINLSPIHILQEGLGQTLLSQLAKHQLSPKVLRLEITENTLLADLDIALRRLDELRELGFKLMLDDFGTGYSSMSYLSRFSIDYIKIDKSFVHALENKTNRAIVNSIVMLARNLELDCVVEGVETETQLSYMSQLGCHLIQGYFYSKPLPLKDFTSLELYQDSQHRDTKAHAN